MSDLPEALVQMAERLEALERRVAALEGSAAPVSHLDQAVEAVPAALAVEDLQLAQAGGGFAVLGKALLGIAGAYILRAVAESNVLPMAAIAALAIVYALVWLVLAARAKAWMANAAYAATSGLILAPMLWELTLRFKVFPASVAALALGAFAVAATALAWKPKLGAVFAMAYLTTATGALSLAIGSHEMLPFATVLVLLAVLAEGAALGGRAERSRPLVALAADLAVFILMFIYSGAPETRADFPALGAAAILWPGCAVFAIYAAAIGVRTVVKGLRISIFETAQAMVAFLLVAGALVEFLPSSGKLALGGASLVLAVGTYAGAFLRFESFEERRNFEVFSGWSVGLLLIGCLLSMSGLAQAVALSVVAVAATVLGGRLDRRALEFHGLIYVLAAAGSSGLLVYAMHAMAGARPAGLGAPVWIASLAALVCYATAKFHPGERWRQQVLHLLEALLAAWAATALAVEGVLGLAALGLTPDLHHIAFARSLILCLLALGLAYAGARWRRVELKRIAWTALGFMALKLVLEDLRHGHLGFIAGSIVLFAVALIAVPRLARMAPDRPDAEPLAH